MGGIKGETNENSLKELLALVKLDRTGKKKVREFSLGMRQRLGIACALTSNPEVLVLDEPMNGVDPEGIVELREMLLKLCREKNITLLISSHILGELFQLSSDFIFIKSGRILNITDKKTIEDSNSEVIEIGTTDIVKTYEFLRREYGEQAVTLEDGIIRLKKINEDEALITKKIIDAGFSITKINTLPFNLEEYYMKEIIGNEDK